MINIRYDNMHLDLKSLLSSLNAKMIELNGASGYLHTTPRGDFLLGWVTWPSTNMLHSVLQHLRQEHLSRRIVTFIPRTNTTGLNFKGNWVWGKPFVEAIHDLNNLDPDPPAIRKAEHIKELEKLNPVISADGVYSVRLIKEWHAFSSLSENPFLIAYDPQDNPVGCIVVHGASCDVAWLRRLYIVPWHRGYGTAKRLLVAGMCGAAKRGFRAVSGLVPVNIWELGMHKALGFQRNREVWSAYISWDED